MKEVLNSEKVHEIFRACLFKDGEEKVTYLPAPGIVTNVGFHPGRIAEKRDEIAAMLDELPDNFREEAAGGGGGCSFLQACMDKHGNHWAEHPTMEKLFQLGIAAGKASYLPPREMWSALPGGMPHIVIHADFKEVEEAPVPAGV